MVYEIGKVPFTDDRAKGTNVALCHRTVYLKTLGGNYVIQAEGYSAGELPEPRKDFDDAIAATRRFIIRNGGTHLRRPALAGVCRVPGRRIIKSDPNPAAVRFAERQRIRDKRR